MGSLGAIHLLPCFEWHCHHLVSWMPSVFISVRKAKDGSTLMWGIISQEAWVFVLPKLVGGWTSPETNLMLSVGFSIKVLRNIFETIDIPGCSWMIVATEISKRSKMLEMHQIHSGVAGTGPVRTIHFARSGNRLFSSRNHENCSKIDVNDTMSI